MTKINPDIHNIQKVPDKSGIQKTEKTDNPVEKPFSGLLAEKLAPTETKPSSLQGTSSLPEIGQTGSIRFSLADPAVNTKDLGVETSLGLLEEYTSLLMDPERSLKEAYETLDRLLKSTADMEEQVLESGNLDTALKEIVDRITATVRTEQIKMDRGDYLDQF